jgi:hypothetical protein
VDLITATLSTAAEGDEWKSIQPLEDVALTGTTLELAVPFEALGELQTGDRLTFIAVASQQGRDLDIAPSAGPARVVVPELQPVTALLMVQDPEGDDHGPGSYTYPTDPLFDPGAFDLKQFVVGKDEQNLVFTFSFVGPVNNPWGSGIGLSVQTMDVYIDTDHQAGSGRRLLLPGRNAALPPEEAWDYVVWVEGWTPGVYKVDEAGDPQQVGTEMRTTVDPVAQTVTVRVPRGAFPDDDPATWSYLGAVLGQEGFPVKGVWRVRDVEEEAAQYRFGGGPANSTNHTRIIDLAWPVDATPTQEQMLGQYPLSQEPDMDKLGPDDSAQVRMLQPE